MSTVHRDGGEGETKSESEAVRVRSSSEKHVAGGRFHTDTGRVGRSAKLLCPLATWWPHRICCPLLWSPPWLPSPAIQLILHMHEAKENWSPVISAYRILFWNILANGSYQCPSGPRILIRRYIHRYVSPLCAVCLCRVFAWIWRGCLSSW